MWGVVRVLGSTVRFQTLGPCIPITNCGFVDAPQHSALEDTTTYFSVTFQACWSLGWVYFSSTMSEPRRVSSIWKADKNLPKQTHGTALANLASDPEQLQAEHVHEASRLGHVQARGIRRVASQGVTSSPVDLHASPSSSLSYCLRLSYFSQRRGSASARVANNMSTLVLLDSFWEGLATPGAEPPAVLLGVEGFHAEKWTAAVAKLYPKSLTSYFNGLPTKLPRNVVGDLKPFARLQWVLCVDQYNACSKSPAVLIPAFDVANMTCIQDFYQHTQQNIDVSPPKICVCRRGFPYQNEQHTCRSSAFTSPVPRMS